MKRFPKILVVLVVVLLLVVLTAPRLIGGLVATAVRKGGTYALGTGTELDSASVQLDGVELRGLRVDNPPGFDTPAFVQLGQARLEVDLASLRSETVVSPLFLIDGLDVYIERKDGKTNYSPILERLEELGAGEGGAGDDEPAGGDDQDGDDPGGKTFLVRKVQIRGVKAHLDLLPLGGERTTLTLDVPPLELEDVGNAGGDDSGTTVAGLFDRIVRATLDATLEAGGDQLPADLVADLQGRLEGVLEAELEGVRGKLDDGARDALDRLESDLEKKLGDALKR